LRCYEYTNQTCEYYNIFFHDNLLLASVLP